MDSRYRSVEVICHWDPFMSLHLERHAFVQKAKENAKRALRMGKFKDATATPNAPRTDSATPDAPRPANPANPMNLDGASVFSASGLHEYDPNDWGHRKDSREGHRPTDDDMDTQSKASKRTRGSETGTTRTKQTRKTNPSTSSSTTGSTGSSSGSGSSSSGSSGSSGKSTVDYGEGSDAQDYESSARVTSILIAMLDNQKQLSAEFRRVIKKGSEESMKTLLGVMSAEILRGNPLNRQMDDDPAEGQLSAIDRDSIFRDFPDFEKSLSDNQVDLYEFSIRDILIAFKLHHVNPENLETFITFILNPACRMFMATMVDEPRSTRIGALNALVTVYVVLFDAREKEKPPATPVP